MAATGGGKIRSRRYHIASKPYAKSKQQSGLISRVTDTVKSIVPSWLTKYFRNGEAADGVGVVLEAEQNRQAPPLNGSEEVAPLPDGRDSPQPSTSNTEPATSKSLLSFQDSLSRPPLNRSHLHFPSLDASSPLGGTSSLFTLPSTSSAPFSANTFAAASSSFSLVKEIKDNSSQHEDDNISTTSGFSSRASEKDVPNSKTASLPQLWSPEMDRTHSGPQQSQASLKKPTFNLSVFGSSSTVSVSQSSRSSTSTINSSVLNSSQLGDSPFYPGKTTYGGAAAVRTVRSRTATPYHAPIRRQIKAKPAGAQPCGVTSATARRILQSLERMSSPLADAKRIPSTASPLSSSLDGSTLEFTHFQAKKKRMDSPLPPVQKLVVPSAAPVSGNRSMAFKPSLTPGGFSRPFRDTPTRPSPVVPDGVAGPSLWGRTSVPDYPLSSTPAASASSASGGGKMKRERTSTRPPSKRSDDQVVELLDLPAVSLPISTSLGLPAFSFATAATKATTVASVLELPVTNTVTPTTAPSTPPSTPFTFSSPIVMATAASPPSFSPSSGFTFSAPVVKTGPSVCNEKKTSPVVAAVKHAASEDTDEFEGPFKPAKVLKEGSVLDILKGPGFACPVTRTSPVPKARQETSTANAPSLGDLFKAPAGSWECSMCMVQNKPTDSNCLACMNPQPNSNSSEKMESIPSTSSRLNATTTTTTASGFGSMFSKPAGTWDCDTCLVQNKPEAVKCVACETAKPGTGVKATLTMPAFSEAKTLPTAAPLIGFGDKFKKPEGAWDCDVCMVQNKAQDIKCVSCMSAKPGAAPPQSLPHSTSTTSLLGFGDRFKKPVGAWDCDTCCVQNKAADQECVSCQTPKPGAKVEPKAFGSSSFGIQASSDSSGGFKFGTGLSSNLNTSSGGFKFGTTHLDSSTSGGFKFGLAASSDASADTSSSADFKFGTPAASSLAPGKEKALSLGDGIKFGNTGGFQFGVAVGMENNAPEGGFTFGLSKSEEKTATAAPSSSTFSLPDSTQNPSGASVVTTATTTTTPAAPLFGKPAEAEPPYLATPLGGSVFGETFEKDPAKPSTPAFTFGKPEEKSGSVGTGFLFSASKEEAAPPTGFSFSTPDCKDQSKAPPFTFGKPSDTPESTAVEPAKPSFSFGQSTTDAATPKPAFGFVPSTTTSSAPAPSLFGAPSSSVPATSTFLFGQSASSEATPTKTFLFGQSQDSQPAPETSLSTAPAQPFQFGCRTNCAAPSFAFGAAAPSTASSAAPPAAPSLFMFSPASAAGFGPGQAPAFGSSQPSVPAFGSTAPSPFSTTSSQPPAFGAKPNSVPVFGQQTNSTPSFGSSTPTAPGVGFQFGAASVFGASSNNTGVFAFGGQPGGSPATPTMAPQTTAPALGGGFNFSTPSNFTIGTTKSTTLTTAPTVQHAITGRKIKTAVRRKK